MLDKEGNTPLHCAVSVQHLHIIAHLAERGGDLNIYNKKR